MADDRIEVEIVLDDGSIQKGFARVKKEGKRAGKEVQGAFGRLRKTFGGIGSQLGALKSNIVAFGAIFAASLGGRAIIQAAARQEEAVNNLNVALRLAGDNVSETSKQVQEFAAAIERTTRVADEAVLEVFALARTFTASADQAQELVKAAIDLEAATGGAITLESAVRNLGKTFAGLTGELGEVLPGLKEFTAEQLRSGAALEFVQDRFGGAAQQQVNTFAGATERLSNSFGTLLERLGALIIQSPKTIENLQRLSGLFDGLADKVKAAFPEAFLTRQERLRKELRELNKVVFDFETRIERFEDKSLVPVLFINELERAKSRIQEIIPELRKLNQEAARPAGTAEFTSRLQEALKASQDVNQQQLAELEKTFNDRLLVLNTALERELVTLEQFELSKTNLTQQFEKKREQLLVSFGDRQAILAKNISTAVNNALISGISNGIAAFGASLAQGENAFESFGKTILGILGDLLINIGTAIIAASTAIDALRNTLTTLFGGFGIAGGIALIALGGVLKGLSGGLGSIGTATAGGGTAAGATIDSDTGIIEPEGEDDIERSTAVTVNVEGTVIDPKTTGENIASALQEFFDASGGQLVVNT